MADPGFQVRGVHLKKLRRTEGGAKMFGVFRVKNHDFTQTNHIFSAPKIETNKQQLKKAELKTNKRYIKT
jgi:hypothetical protein